MPSFTDVRLRCLIVDDNSSFLDAARALLEREGIVVLGVSTTAARGLADAQALEPDVVLVDVVLGEESGFQLARRLHEAGFRVVMISTHAESDIDELVVDSPAAGFIPKSELSAEAIRRTLGGGTTPQPSGAG